MTAWIALGIAAASLLWNVVSTVRTWRRGRVKIELEVAGHDEPVDDDIGHIMRLRVTAVNRGGASVSVVAVGAGLGEDSAWVHEASPSRSYGSFGLAGPELPVTVDVNHEVTWDLDLALVIGSGLYEQEITIVPYVRLSGGQRVAMDYSLNEWERARALEVFELRHQHHDEGATLPSEATKRNCPYCKSLAIDANAYPPRISIVSSAPLGAPYPYPVPKAPKKK